MVSTSIAADAIVDDLIDSGNTKQAYAEKAAVPFYALVDKQKEGITDWVVFPWEVREEKTTEVECITRFLQRAQIDITVPGREKTPERFVAAFHELTNGTNQSAVDMLRSALFKQEYNEMVVLSETPFVSVCEHHLLPFTGIAHIAYIPGADALVTGLSKLSRALGIVSHRLQMQERIAWELAHAIQEALSPAGVAVVLEGAHTCMSCRGVRQPGRMVTSCMLGIFRDNESTRMEFLHLIGRK
jgi:GTP cyclohydrolase I